MTQATSTRPAETKAATLKRLLARKSGADLAALQEATGWQAHSVRAALSTLRKAGYTVERTPPRTASGSATYRITATPEGA